VLFDADDPLGPAFRDAIEATLSSIMADRRAEVVACEAALGPVVDALTPLATAGKHVRAAFVWWGHAAVAGEPSDPAPLLKLAASLDLVHAGLLAHDDLMDGSDTRRARPSTHRAIAAFSPPGNDTLGLAGAVVGGAMLLQWAQQAADESGLTTSDAARAELNALRSRVLTGQMVDAWAAAGLPLTGPGGAQRLGPAQVVAEIGDLKTASYTVVGPLRLGASVAGATPQQLDAMTAFGRPLGHAFQSRDDVLGVFGDEQVTGKPAGDDLREAKATQLVQNALELAAPSDAATLRAMLGNRSATQADVAQARAIIAGCGALDATETAIAADLTRALDALDAAELRPAGKAGLASLAHACVHRHA